MFGFYFPQIFLFKLHVMAGNTKIKAFKYNVYSYGFFFFCDELENFMYYYYILNHKRNVNDTR